MAGVQLEDARAVVAVDGEVPADDGEVGYAVVQGAGGGPGRGEGRDEADVAAGRLADGS